MSANVDLLDASVWVPLSAPDHVHHERARLYWENEAAETVAFCRVTALALLRHLTNTRVMQHAVQTSSGAWDTLERWLRLPEIRLIREPAGVDERLARFSQSMNLGPALWTDAYLAAFALTGRQRLVAFDADFARFADLEFLHLVA